MANIPEALAAKRRTCVKRMLEKLARGESGSRWELTEWGPHNHSDDNFMLAVVKRMIKRGLVQQSEAGTGVPTTLSAVPGVSIDASDEAAIGLCWPSYAAQQPELTDEQLADAALARAESAGGEEMAVEPGDLDKLDLVLRVVGHLAENVVYMREKLDGQKPSAAPDLDAVVELLGSIEGKADQTTLRTRLDQMFTRLGAIENKLPEFEDRKLADSLKVANAIAVGANEQGEKVENALQKFDQRIAAVDQAVGALLKRPTAHVQVPADPRVDEVVKKLHALGNSMAAISNKQEAMAKGVAAVESAAEKMTKSFEVGRVAWNQSAEHLTVGLKDLARLMVSQATAFASFEDALRKWAVGVDKAIELWTKFWSKAKIEVVPDDAKKNGDADAPQR